MIRWQALVFLGCALSKQLFANDIQIQDPSLAGMPLSDAEYEHFFKTLNSPHRATAICFLRGMYGCQNSLIQTLDLYENHGIVPEGPVCSNLAEMPTFPDFCTLSFYRCTVKKYYVKRVQCPDENSETAATRPISSHHHHTRSSSTLQNTQINAVLITADLTTKPSSELLTSVSVTSTSATEAITAVTNTTAEAVNASEIVIIAADPEPTFSLPPDMMSSTPTTTDSQSLLELLTSLDAMIAGQSFPELFTTHHPRAEKTFLEQSTFITNETLVANLPSAAAVTISASTAPVAEEAATISASTAPMTKAVTISVSIASVTESSSVLATTEAASPSLPSTATNPATILTLEASLGTAATQPCTAPASSHLPHPISQTLTPSSESPILKTPAPIAPQFSIASWPLVPISGILEPYRLQPTSVMELFVLSSAIGSKKPKSEGMAALSSLLQIGAKSARTQKTKQSPKSKQPSRRVANVADFLSRLQDRRVQQLLKKIRKLMAKKKKKQRQLQLTSLQLLSALKHTKKKVKSSFLLDSSS